MYSLYCSIFEHSADINDMWRTSHAYPDCPVRSEFQQSCQNDTSSVRTSPVLSAHHQSCQNTTSPVRTPPVLLEHHQFCQNTTSTVRTPPVLSEHHQSCQNITSPVRTPPVLSEHRILKAYGEKVSVAMFCSIPPAPGLRKYHWLTADY